MRDQLAALDRCRQLLVWARRALVQGRADEAAVHLSALRRDLPRPSSVAKSCFSAAGRASMRPDTHKRRAAGGQPCRSSQPFAAGPRREDPTSCG